MADCKRQQGGVCGPLRARRRSALYVAERIRCSALRPAPAGGHVPRRGGAAGAGAPGQGGHHERAHHRWGSQQGGWGHSLHARSLPSFWLQAGVPRAGSGCGASTSCQAAAAFPVLLTRRPAARRCGSSCTAPLSVTSLHAPSHPLPRPPSPTPAGEWYMRNSHFPGWGRPYEFASQLMARVGRGEESRDVVSPGQPAFLSVGPCCHSGPLVWPAWPCQRAAGALAAGHGWPAQPWWPQLLSPRIARRKRGFCVGSRPRQRPGSPHADPSPRPRRPASRCACRGGPLPTALPPSVTRQASAAPQPRWALRRAAAAPFAWGVCTAWLVVKHLRWLDSWRSRAACTGPGCSGASSAWVADSALGCALPHMAGTPPPRAALQVRRALEEHDEMSNMPGMKTVIKTGEGAPLQPKLRLKRVLRVQLLFSQLGRVEQGQPRLPRMPPSPLLQLLALLAGPWSGRQGLGACSCRSAAECQVEAAGRPLLVMFASSPQP